MAVTYNDIYLKTRRTLKNAGVEAFALEARLLLCYAMDCSKEQLMSRLPMYAPNDAPERVEALTRRRCAGEPVAYITGSWEFYGLPMAVNKNVLIPRMDTEVLVDTAVEALRGHKMDARILDLGCGSGCIGCAIARTLPAVRLTSVDISPDALAVCRKNIALNRLGNRAVTLEADLFSPPPLRLGNFDIIVSNPPYIASGEIPTLDNSVKDWEPMLALDGGEDGLDCYRAITKLWLSVLSDNGLLIMEVGEEQAADVIALMEAAGLRNCGTVRDTAGTERVVYGQK